MLKGQANEQVKFFYRDLLIQFFQTTDALLSCLIFMYKTMFSFTYIGSRMYFWNKWEKLNFDYLAGWFCSKKIDC